MFVVISCRSKKNIWKIGFFSNKFLIFSIALAIFLQLLVIYTPVSSILGLKPISIGEIILCISLSSLIFIFFEIKKFIAPIESNTQ
jgi:Ca2+-transporting ATPase